MLKKVIIVHLAHILWYIAMHHCVRPFYKTASSLLRPPSNFLFHLLYMFVRTLCCTCPTATKWMSPAHKIIANANNKSYQSVISAHADDLPTTRMPCRPTSLPSSQLDVCVGLCVFTSACIPMVDMLYCSAQQVASAGIVLLLDSAFFFLSIMPRNTNLGQKVNFRFWDALGELNCGHFWDHMMTDDKFHCSSL